MQETNEYILITSAYNESNNIRHCIESVLRQSILPLEWIIIDNGSTDNTCKIIKTFLSSYPFIKIYYKPYEMYKVSGYHALINFYFGLSKVKSKAYKYLGNLDADIVIDNSNYYEYQMGKMNNDRKIGITTGVTYYYDNNGKKHLINHKPWHTTGALKFYRRDCFESLGKMSPDLGWDGADEMKAMSRGWKTITFYQLQVNHLGKIKALEREKNEIYYYNRGFSIFRRGYPIWYIIIKAFQTLKAHPSIFAVSLLKGYFKGFLSNQPNILTKKEIRFLRKFHLSRLLTG